MRIPVIVTVLSFFLSGLTVPTHAVESHGDYSAEQLNVEVWFDKSKGSVYEPGEEVEIFFTASHDCYMVVYDVDTQGFVNVLFPRGDESSWVDAERIGIWGHSNGGLIGLRMITITQKAKAALLWAGVVGSYADMLETYLPRIDFLQRLSPPVIEQHGLPSENPEYWDYVDPFTYLEDITTPVQLHHGNSDSSVPVDLSISLYNAMVEAGKEVELYQYPGMDHNFFGEAFDQAMQRSVEFFKARL